MEMISIGNQCDVASTTAPPLFTNRWSKRTPSIPSAPECCAGMLCAGMLCAGMLWAGMGLHRMRPAENDTVDRRRWAIKRPWLLPLLLLTVDSNQNKISSIIARFSHSMSARVCVCVCVCSPVPVDWPHANNPRHNAASLQYPPIPAPSSFISAPSRNCRDLFQHGPSWAGGFSRGFVCFGWSGNAGRPTCPSAAHGMARRLLPPPASPSMKSNPIPMLKRFLMHLGESIHYGLLPDN